MEELFALDREKSLVLDRSRGAYDRGGVSGVPDCHDVQGLKTAALRERGVGYFHDTVGNIQFGKPVAAVERAVAYDLDVFRYVQFLQGLFDKGAALYHKHLVSLYFFGNSDNGCIALVFFDRHVVADDLIIKIFRGGLGHPQAVHVRALFGCCYSGLVAVSDRVARNNVPARSVVVTRAVPVLGIAREHVALPCEIAGVRERVGAEVIFKRKIRRGLIRICSGDPAPVCVICDLVPASGASRGERLVPLRILQRYCNGSRCRLGRRLRSVSRVRSRGLGCLFLRRVFLNGRSRRGRFCRRGLVCGRRRRDLDVALLLKVDLERRRVPCP